MANFLTRSRNKKEIADMATVRPGGIVRVERPEEWYAVTGDGWYEEAPFDHTQISKSVEMLTGPVKIYQSSCHNCGAPYEPVRCSYCGTYH